MTHPQDGPQGRAENNIANDGTNQGAQGVFHGAVTTITTIVQTPAPAVAAAPGALTLTEREKLLALLAERYAERIAGNLAYAVRLQLGLHTRPAAVDPAWRRLHLRGPRLPARPVPPGTPPLELFDQLQRQVLVLGAPGAGKTTLLVELAQALTRRAQTDPSQPVPVVLNLASWQATQTIRVWLVDALRAVLSVSKRFAARLAEGQELLLLLDGLDELAEGRRAACVAAINDYLESIDLGPALAVGCRSGEYAALGVKLAISGAVELEPLDLPAIEHALADVPAAHGVLLALQTDDLLRELARTPLIVNVLLLAYAGQAVPAVQVSTPEELRAALWTAYLQRMLVQRPLAKPWQPDQALRCLVWLAGLLRVQSETNFLLDDLQPEALPTEKLRLWYLWLLRLIGGLSGGVIGASIGLFFGVIIGLVFEMMFGLAFVVIMVPFNILFGVFISVILVDSKKIVRQENVRWSWLDFWRSLRRYWMFLVFLGFLHGFVGKIIGLFFKEYDLGFLGGLIASVVVGLLIGLYSGWQVKVLSDQLMPLQGIFYSLSTGLFRSLVYALSFGVLLMSLGAFTREIGVIASGMMFGITSGGLGGGFSGGLRTFLQHHILRFVLARTGLLPFRSVAFLDGLCERLLLERDGAVYRFRHILLRDFCAELTDAQIAELAREADG